MTIYIFCKYIKRLPVCIFNIELKRQIINLFCMGAPLNKYLLYFTIYYYSGNRFLHLLRKFHLFNYYGC